MYSENTEDDMKISKVEDNPEDSMSSENKDDLEVPKAKKLKGDTKKDKKFDDLYNKQVLIQIMDDPEDFSSNNNNKLNLCGKILIQNIDEPENSKAKKFDDPKNSDQHPDAKKLNPDDDLSKIRKELDIDETTLFSIKKEKNLYSDIEIVDEKSFLLRDIIGDNNTLYLRTPYWKKLKLDYGRNINTDKINKIKIANKRAFNIKKSQMSKICSEVNQVVKTTEIDSYFSDDIDFDLQSFKNESLICNYNEYGKEFLKLNLEPTKEFIEAVEKVIEKVKKSGDHTKFKEITDEYGLFISDEVILGGRAYFKNVGKFIQKKWWKLIGGGPMSLEDFDELAWVKSLEDFKNLNCIKFCKPVGIFQLLPLELREQIIELVGKKIHYSTVQEHTYDLVEANGHIYAKPESILLKVPPKISKIIEDKVADCNFFATAIDKDETDDIFTYQILHSADETDENDEKDEKVKKVKKDEKDEKDGKDGKDGKPRLVIHCIQKNGFKKRKCNLKIRWMVVGYDINFRFLPFGDVKLEVIPSSMDKTDLTYSSFAKQSKRVLCFGIPVLSKSDSNNSHAIGHYFFNDQEDRPIGINIFSYCLEKNQFFKLSELFESLEFTFYTLIISNYPKNSKEYGMLPPKYNIFTKNKFKKQPEKNPKYLSLHTGEDASGQIFLKQDLNEIKLKYIDNCSCQGKLSCICRSKISKKVLKYVEYASFVPTQDEDEN